MNIGVLALQGDFDAHRRRLEELGATVTLVRKAEDFDHIDGLVIPGGESTTFLKLLPKNVLERLRDFVHTKPTFGTCAGAIMLAKHVTNPDQPGLNALDITVERNAYGRQIDSTILEADTKLGGEPLEMVFIRAPRISAVATESKFWPSATTIRCWCGREASWPPPSIPSFPTIPASTPSSSSW